VTSSDFPDLDLSPEADASPPPDAEQSLTGQVVYVNYASARFSAGKLRVAGKKDPVPFAVPVMVAVGNVLHLLGKYEDSKYGVQFKATRCDVDQAITSSGLVSYLANNPAFRGIGPKKAAELARLCGDDFDRVVTETPDRLLEVLSPKELETLTKVWAEDRELNRARIWLAGHGLTNHQIQVLVTQYGVGVRAVLEGDPYLLTRDVDGFGFKRADEIARKVGVAPDSPSRIASALSYALGDAAAQDGHTWVPYPDLVTRASSLLDLYDTDRICAVLDVQIQKGYLVARSAALTRAVGLKSLYEAEIETAEVLSQLAVSRHFPDPEQARRAVAAEPALNRQQRAAVMAALCRNFAVVTGGAGTGKTFTMAAIRRAFASAGLRVLLAAPTGKAAKRMSEMLLASDDVADEDLDHAMTLHRLLGYNRSTYRIDRIARGKVSPEEMMALPDWVDLSTGRLTGVAAVLVDEASMIDAPLARQLLRVVDPAETTVVFFGDHHQLPPVGPGNLLRDLLARRPIPVVVLEEVVRQAGALKVNSTAILQGKVAPTHPGVEDVSVDPSRQHIPWIVADVFPDEKKCREYILSLIGDRIPRKMGLRIQDIQVLCPTRKGAVGTESLNRALQQVVQRALYNRDVPDSDLGRRPPLYPGDRIIQTRNNYGLGLDGIMNGAIGEVVQPADRHRKLPLVARFDGEEVTYDPDDADDVALAYALTIHKSQGSEWPCVVAVLHRSAKFMLTRALAYTAVTRARKTALLVGDAEGIAYAVGRDEVQKRRTWLSVAVELGGRAR
jgi:exodeoxyribonuclease V alpha subunit